MILTVGGIKGGSGKSTLAVHLAVLHSKRGYRTVLLDADEQATSYDFTQLRADRLGAPGYICSKVSGRGVLQAARDLAQVHDAVIIDAGGHDSASQRAALLASELAVFPFVPSAFDLWTLEGLEKLLGDVRSVNPDLVALSYLNRCPARGSQPLAAQEALEANQAIEFTGLRISPRTQLGFWLSRGLIAHESKKRDQTAANEFTLLHGFLCGAYLRKPGRKLSNAKEN